MHVVRPLHRLRKGEGESRGRARRADTACQWLAAAASAAAAAPLSPPLREQREQRPSAIMVANPWTPWVSSHWRGWRGCRARPIIVIRLIGFRGRGRAIPQHFAQEGVSLFACNAEGGGPTPRRMAGRSGNEWMVQEAVLPALARTIAHSQGERALMVCLARQADFSEMMSLAAHPEAKHGLALRLRTLCRRALPLGSALHRKL